jgi:transposase
MPKSRPPYPAEYRRRIVELARAGRSFAELAREFEPTENCIRNWVKQAALDSGWRRDGLTTEEREELNRLRRENRVLREEKEILKNGSGAWWGRLFDEKLVTSIRSVAREERPSAFWCS